MKVLGRSQGEGNDNRLVVGPEPNNGATPGGAPDGSTNHNEEEILGSNVC